MILKNNILKFVFLAFVFYSCSIKEGFYLSSFTHIGSLQIQNDKYVLKNKSDLRTWIDSGRLIKRNFKFYLQSYFEYDSGFYYKYYPFDSNFIKKNNSKLYKIKNSREFKPFVFCFDGNELNWVYFKGTIRPKIKIVSGLEPFNSKDTIIKYFECKPDSILIIYNLNGFIINSKNIYIKKEFLGKDLYLFDNEEKIKKHKFKLN